MKFSKLLFYIFFVAVININLSQATTLRKGSASLDQESEVGLDGKLYDKEVLLNKLIGLEKTAINIEQALRNVDSNNPLIKQEIIKFNTFSEEKDKTINNITANLDSDKSVASKEIKESLFKQLARTQERINILERGKNELKKSDKAIHNKIKKMNGYLVQQEQNIKKHDQQFKIHENAIMNNKVKIHIIEDTVLECMNQQENE